MSKETQKAEVAPDFNSPYRHTMVLTLSEKPGFKLVNPDFPQQGIRQIIVKVDVTDKPFPSEMVAKELESVLGNYAEVALAAIQDIYVSQLIAKLLK